MIEWVRRRKLRKQAKSYFGDDDFIVNSFRLNAVHIIPKEIKKSQELDFYLDTGYDIYLLRLENSKENSITVCPANKFCITIYLVCKIPYTSKNILIVLEKIIRRLEDLGSPKISNPKQEITITF